MTISEKVIVARFYRLASGREPVSEWLGGLPREDRKSIGRDLMKVEFGWPCGPPLCASLAGYLGLYEVRSNVTAKTHCQSVLHRVGEEHGASTRFHQENPGDTREGAEARGASNEGA